MTNHGNSSPTVTNCTFVGNLADEGGGMHNQSSRATVTNCTFSGNSADYGGAVYSVGSPASVVINCVLWGDTSLHGSPETYGTTTVGYSCVQGDHAGTGNTDADPLFTAAADPHGPDGVPGTFDDGLQLQPESPCIDTGTATGAPAADILGVARPQLSGIDMGAYELPNRSPVADAGGPYQADEGSSLVLDGSASYDPDAAFGDQIVSYEWDLDYDGATFDVEAAGEMPSVVFPDDFAERSVALRVTDSYGAQDVASATLAVSNVAPTPDAGPDQTVEQTSAGGAEVALDASASADPGDDVLTYTWSEGGSVLAGPSTDALANVTLPLGAHTVTLTVDDGDGGTATDDVVVVVEDTASPVLAVPAGITVEQTGLGGTPATDAVIADFLAAASAEDICDAAPDISHNAPAFFQLGTTVVTFTVADDSGNAATGTAAVEVVDTTPPEIEGSMEIVAEQEALGGTAVDVLSHIVAVVDVCDAAPTVTVDDAGPYPLGDTDVTVTATDASGNSGEHTITVRIVDTTPPALTAPADIEVGQTELDGSPATHPEIAAFLAGATATDICDAAPIITTDAPSMFPVGTTVVTFTATDASGNPGVGSASVTVVDMVVYMAETLEEALNDAIDEILADPNIPDSAADAVQDALDDIIGNNDGAANNGATDKLADGNLIAALTKLRQAVQKLQDAAADGYDSTDLQAQLTDFARLAVYLAIEEAAETLGEMHPDVVAATALLNEGDALLASGDFLGAIAKYKLAAQELE